METKKTSAQLAIWLSCLMALMIVLGYCVPMGMAAEETPGEAEKCLHENTVMDYQKINLRDYQDQGDGTHAYVYDFVTTELCDDCFKQIAQTTETGLIGYEEHDGDPCSKCGWESCKHLHTQETSSWTDAVYTPNGDGKTHSVTARFWNTVTCLDCGEELSVTDLGEQTRDGWHSYTEDGKTCMECGYVNTCTHPNFIEGEENRENIVLTPNGDGKTHTCTYDQVLISYCPDCEWWSKIERTGEKTVVEPHEYVDGVCACGAVELCQHLHTNEYDYWSSEDAVYKDNGDGKTHSITATVTHYVLCLDCGTYVSETDLGRQTRDDNWHNYSDDGKTCMDCGYVNTCTHPNFIYGEEIRHMEMLTDNGDGQTHTCEYYQELVDYCPDCRWITAMVGTGEKAVVEPHEYVDGVCACGAKEPEATPVPTRTPAPVKTSAPSGGNSGGTTTVKQPEVDIEFIATPEPVATAAPEMVSTLLDTIAQAEAEGSEVSVEVVGAQEVFSEAEYAQLRTLPAQEQMLVTLASIGLEDVVQSALVSMGMTLSEEAEALTAQVAERFAAMGEEERAQVEEKLTQLFPKTEVTVGGVTYEYFVVDLQITVDGKVRVERYGFRYDEELGQWVFEKLDLVDMYVEAE